MPQVASRAPVLCGTNGGATQVRLHIVRLQTSRNSNIPVSGMSGSAALVGKA